MPWSVMLSLGKMSWPIAQQLISTLKPGVEITKGWWDSFWRRHPEVPLRQAEPLLCASAAANSSKLIEKILRFAGRNP